MRGRVRIALVVVGLAAVVCGIASLTGGWLGTPPWWYVEGPSGSVPGMSIGTRWMIATPRLGREWISAGVVAVGLGLGAAGAWHRRCREVVAPRGAIRTALVAMVGVAGVVSGSLLLRGNAMPPPEYPRMGDPLWWEKWNRATDQWLWTELLSLGLVAAGALILILLGVAARQRRRREPAQS